MSKKIILILLILALTFSLIGCGSKIANKEKTDSSVSQLKNAKPVIVAPEVIEKNVQAATKTSDKLSTMGSELDSVDDFTVTDNSGLSN